eukprot:Gb_38792 [translate_table: standard]
MGFWHLLSMATLMSCLSNLNGFLALAEVGGWRSLAWRRGIGDFIHHLHISIFGGEERSIEFPLSFHWSSLGVLEQHQWRSKFSLEFLVCGSWRSILMVIWRGSTIPSSLVGFQSMYFPHLLVVISSMILV